MKLTGVQINEIVDNISEYISDDLWTEFSTDWIDDYLADSLDTEYDREDITRIFDNLTETQHQMQEEALLEEQKDLYDNMSEYLDSLDDMHLSALDIGKVLVKLANSYLNDSYE